METNHWILKTLEIADFKNLDSVINEKRLSDKFYQKIELNEEEKKLLENRLEVFELAIIDILNIIAANENVEEKKNELIKICYYCFRIYRILPIPSDDLEKIKHILKLVSYAYLGEKWEDGRRYLTEHEDVVWKINKRKEDEWDYYLLVNSYLAILYLIRKTSWEDLDSAIKCINSMRTAQLEYEKHYLDNIESINKKGAAYELAAFYHLAKSIELLSEFMIDARISSDNLLNRLDFHFDKAIHYCEISNIIEFDLLLHQLRALFKKIVFNSIWRIAERVNSKVSSFVKTITKSSKPIFELLYPQKVSIMEKGLLDVAKRAIVVNLPTSSGKTFLAEFKILQALNQFSEIGGWIAYVAPTRALVNQITSNLRRDLSKPPLDIKVEKMSGALEIDTFEDNLLKIEKGFDVLVTTPEKLNLLIRQDINKQLIQNLILVIVDEAHNLEDKTRGINLEMLLSIIKNDCKKANFLLLTPLVPNSLEIAKWLDPQNPTSISLKFQWEASDRVIGIYFPKGSGTNWKTVFKPLITSQETITLDDEFLLGENPNLDLTLSSLKTKYLLTSIVAMQIQNLGNTLLLARTIKSCWKIGSKLYEIMPNLSSVGDEVRLVMKFVAAELGGKFPLVSYLEKGIGVHNAGLPDEIRNLMEWLMEEGKLKVLVATSTIAQGINFPVSNILISSYSYPFTSTMPTRDFWNLVGRAGRINQSSLGVVGIASPGLETEDALKTINYVKLNTKNLVSALVTMLDTTLNLVEEHNFEALSYKTEWSAFLQYISHIYRQYQNLESFTAELELTLRNTYGYSLLEKDKQTLLVNSMREYSKKLDENKHLCTLSDQTGFSPESIEKTIRIMNKIGISQSDWNTSRLFSSDSKALRKLIQVMFMIPEIRSNLKEVKIPGTTRTYTSVSRLIEKWVSGTEIPQIAIEFWKNNDPESLSECVKSIYRLVSNSAAWGLSSIQKIPGSGLDFEQLSEDEIKKINNLPSMVYYGVKTDHAIMMRMNNVPRSIAESLGKVFKEDNKDLYSTNPKFVTDWLYNLDDEIWQKTIPPNKDISGKEYKEVWKKISGFS